MSGPCDAAGVAEMTLFEIGRLAAIAEKACTAVIDSRAETGRRLAGAYCIRGHELTETRELVPDHGGAANLTVSVWLARRPKNAPTPADKVEERNLEPTT